MKKIIVGITVSIICIILLKATMNPNGVDINNALKAFKQQNYKKAFILIEPHALSGNSRAQIILATLYLNGYSVKKDIDKAVDLLNRASSQGDVRAHYRLITIYMTKEYERQNYKKALKWLKKAADTGHVDSKFMLGRMYFEGKGTKKNNSIAKTLLLSSYNSGELSKSDEIDASIMLIKINQN